MKGPRPGKHCIVCFVGVFSCCSPCALPTVVVLLLSPHSVNYAWSVCHHKFQYLSTHALYSTWHTERRSDHMQKETVHATPPMTSLRGRTDKVGRSAGGGGGLFVSRELRYEVASGRTSSAQPLSFFLSCRARDLSLEKGPRDGGDSYSVEKSKVLMWWMI